MATALARWEPRLRKDALLCDSDATLVARAQRGEAVAFERLAQRHGKAVLGLIRQSARDGHAAEDAAQEALLIAWRQIGRLEGPEKFAGWLYRIAIREGRRAARAARREIPAGDLHQETPNGEDQAMRERRAGVRQAVGELQEPYRLVITLRYIEGLNAAEIAARLSVPHGTVRSRLARARDRLQKKLRRYLP